MTQERLVLTHLKRHRTITPKQAVERYSIYRLADVVFKLRRHGYMVLTEPQRANGSTYAKYRLV